MNQS